ncbi:unnamed protein product [Soboliphyme baturini]|uniref:E3 ubiquitin-protein ligase n=1 Tax=Soboliphyme baturini TaxID=241478 RepID=A0A183IVM9_9BILA|nr:unnamed protein product [Soboliphyme baturini]
MDLDCGTAGNSGGKESSSHSSSNIVSTLMHAALQGGSVGHDIDACTKMLWSRSLLKRAVRKQSKQQGSSNGVSSGKSSTSAARTGNLREAVAAVMHFLSNSSDSESDFYLDGATDYAMATQLLAEMEDDENATMADDLEDDTDMDVEEEDNVAMDDGGAGSSAGLGGGVLDLTYFTPMSLGYAAEMCYEANCNSDSIIRRSYSSLLPAFDPRPGRANINQMQDVTLPDENGDDRADTSMTGGDTEDSVEEQDEAHAKGRLRLYLSCQKSTGTSGTIFTDISVPLVGDARSFFYYVQKLVQRQRIKANGKIDSSVRIWDPVYTLCYEQEPAASNQAIAAAVTTTNGGIGDGDDLSFGISKDERATLVLVLEILRMLLSLYNGLKMTGWSLVDDLSREFLSKKLTQKIVQQLGDSLVVCTLSLPDWCDWLMLNYPFLFTYDVRNMYFYATAFGTSRSTVWLQKQLEQQMELQRGKLISRPITVGHRHESQVGRIKHEKIKIMRKPSILNEAMRIMRFHARNKAILEVEFEAEEGTGLGPTLEFYALIAVELQKKSLGIWLFDDDDRDMPNVNGQLSSDRNYIMRSGGLFPAPLPQDSAHCDEACLLQDKHLIDLPLSLPFIKLMCCPHHPSICEDLDSKDKQSTSSNVDDQWSVEAALMKTGDPPISWCHACLSLEDLEVINPFQGKFFKALHYFCDQRRHIIDDQTIPEDKKRELLSLLSLDSPYEKCCIDDLGLSFEFSASSCYYHYLFVQLTSSDSDALVTVDNLERYLTLCEEYYLNVGIRRQMNAFRLGFNSVFPMEKLRCFSSRELLVRKCAC